MILIIPWNWTSARPHNKNERIMVVAFLWMILLSELGVSSARTVATCTFSGQRYDVGDIWHPRLEPFIPNARPCINCTCEAGGKVNCVSPKCPRPECEVPITPPGQCCPTCELQLNEGDGLSTPSAGCNFNGELHDDGAVFASDKTGVTPTRADQCVMCVCSTGHVLCHLKTCENVGKCKKYVNVTDDCCPQCEEEPDYKDYLDMILSGGRPTNRSKTDCVTVIGNKKNGETWNPPISVYGRHKCITCSCKAGRVTCARKTCPSVDSLPCRNPVYVEGECCKSCPGRKRDCKRRRGKDGKKRRRCKKNGGRNGRKSRRNKSTATPLPVTQAPPSLFSSMCLPKRVDRFVYQLEQRKSVVLIFDDPSEDKVDVFSWTIKKGRLSEMSKETKASREIRGSIQQSNILGATNKRNFKKFKRKLRKKLQRCKTSCRRKVITGCVKRLKLKAVKFGKQCGK